MWPDRRILELFKTEFPIVLAPMAGIMDADLVIAAAQGGALGSLPCAMLSVENILLGTDHDVWTVNVGPIIRSSGSTRRRLSTPPTARRSMPRCANLSRS